MKQQESLWDSIWEQYKITKPIRLIELFSGIGAQFKALKQLTDKVESWKTCEWAYNSIIAYNSIHHKDNTDYAKDMTKEQLLDYLQGNISLDYNQPADLSKKSLEWLKTCYNSCIANHNLMNIMKVKAKDLEIVDRDKYEYILTYSFPCQDLSLSGKRQGMSVSQKDGGTRSGLLWEVERLLDELNGNLPQVLLMENVPQVIGANSIKDFEKWQAKLYSLGYESYIENIYASEFGIPQERKRCFMVSILGQYSYHYPEKIPLRYNMLDFLSRKVDEKYYLSDKKIESISNWKAQQNPFETMEKTMESGICPTITARGEGEEHSGMILIDEEYIGLYDYAQSDTLRPTEESRIHIGKKVSGTILASGNQNGIIVKRYKNYISWKNNKGEFNTQCNRASLPNDLCLTIPTTDMTKVVVEEDGVWKIRKMTPLESLKLMGFEQKDYESMKQVGLSDMAIYHCAGDSIVVSVLMGIFSNLINDEYDYKGIIENYVKTLQRNE